MRPGRDIAALARNRRVRGWLLQALTILAATAVVAVAVLTARENLLRQGIATGFGFLRHSTGWPISFALIDTSANSPYWRMLIAGLLNTLLVGSLGIVLASAIGLFLGLARISTNLVLNLIGTLYVETFRNVPLILQVVFWYALLNHLPSPRQAISLGDVVFLSNRGLMFPAPVLSADIIAAACAAGLAAAAAVMAAHRAGRLLRVPLLSAMLVPAAAVLAIGAAAAGGPVLSLPQLQGLRFVGGFAVKPEFSALLFGIAIFGGAYVGEIVRSGFLAVPAGAIEAARALGLRPGQVNRLVRIPIAIRAILPALANHYVWLMKATTLGIAVGFPDYFMVISTAINQSGQSIELIALLMAGFLAINYALAGAMNLLNARIAIPGRADE